MLEKSSYDYLNKQEKLIFLAGVFEGEGSFGLWGKQIKNNKYLSLKINMTDKDILERFLDFFKVGAIYADKLQINRKPMWRWQITGIKAMEVLLQMAPYFGIRRKEKFEQCYQSCKQLPHLRKSYLIQLIKQSQTKTLPLN
jgi:hypothetical protein